MLGRNGTGLGCYKFGMTRVLYAIANATSRSGCSNSPSPPREEKGSGDEEVRPA